MKLGSLFDGSGGFPLAGALNGVEPVWASEIEPFPIRVTTARFPNMKHLGDICQIDGSKIEPVDIITFGSPCQDLSVAGRQKGIHEGERSNLFFEAIRIIKEMRQATDGRYPRFIVWENVPGAFSSNKGEDFRAVLEAIGSIMEDGLSISRPKKWGHAGAMVGKGWSVAWRVYDAQYWPGTPQRRKRIYLIADFATERAREILFECQGMSGDHQSSGKTRDNVTPFIEKGTGGDNRIDATGDMIQQNVPYYSLTTHFSEYKHIKPTLRASGGDCGLGSECLLINPKTISLEGNGQRPSHSGDGYSEEQVSYILNATEQHGVCYSTTLYEMQHSCDVIRENKDIAPTLQHRMGTGDNIPLTMGTIGEKVKDD